MRQQGRSKAHPFNLTDRQMDVWMHLSDGLSNPEIAALLGVRVPTVKSHIRTIFLSTGTENRTQAAVLFHKRRRT